MQRTQIYLTERETEALDRAAKASGHTRSHLIREAIAERYLRKQDSGEIERALRATAGGWQQREATGADAVERLRSGRLGRIHGA